MKNRKYLMQLLAGMLMAATLSTLSSPAEAYCAWNTDTGTLSGWKIGYEKTRYTSTCDNDNFYAGSLKDHWKADGASVQVQFSIDFGPWFTQYYTGSTSWRNYNFQSSGDPIGIRLKSNNSGATGSATITNF